MMLRNSQKLTNTQLSCSHHKVFAPTTITAKQNSAERYLQTFYLGSSMTPKLPISALQMWPKISKMQTRDMTEPAKM